MSVITYADALDVASFLNLKNTTERSLGRACILALVAATPATANVSSLRVLAKIGVCAFTSRKQSRICDMAVTFPGPALESAFNMSYAFSIASTSGKAPQVTMVLLKGTTKSCILEYA